MPLAMATIGSEVRIKKILGNEKTKSHLEHLGFLQGETIRVVSELNGSLILNVKDTRVAVNKVMANKIMVN